MVTPKKFELDALVGSGQAESPEQSSGQSQASIANSEPAASIQSPRSTDSVPISQSASNIGKVIAEQLEATGYHPVVVFGSSNSGKSSLLGSLFSYFQANATNGIGIFLGESFLPEDTPYGSWANKEAETFFYKGVQEFLAGKAHAATRSEYPFFVPIRITPKNSPEIKFAFMESNGEWYKPKKDTGRYFSELKEEINTLLAHYQRGISFIHIAPYTQIDAWTSRQDGQNKNQDEIADADLALVGALNSYERMRTFKGDDSHMFLMTKWDACKRWEGDRDLIQLLSDIDALELEEAMKVSYLKGFSAFNNINVEKHQKNIMQYCSGIMIGREIVKANAEIKGVIDRYPQTMWNWLYGNATICHPSINTRLQLLPKPRPPRKGLIDLIHDSIESLLN